MPLHMGTYAIMPMSFSRR